MMWLSFADPTRPTGRQFLGAAIVRADRIITAVRRAHALGINPGGEVMSMWIDPAMARSLSFKLPIERLLSPEEARELHRRIDAELR